MIKMCENKTMRYMLISFAMLLLAFASFLITEEPTKATAYEWICNIATITTAANLAVSLVVFTIYTAWKGR